MIISLKKITLKKGPIYNWNLSSTYVKKPPFFSNNFSKNNGDIINARVLIMLGDSVTTDHISPAGSIKKESSAGKYLYNRQVPHLSLIHI